MTAPDAARAAVRAELTECLRAQGRPDAEQLAGLLTPFVFVGIDTAGYQVVPTEEPKPSATGTCRVCRGRYTVTAMSRIRQHGACTGGGQEPAEILRIGRDYTLDDVRQLIAARTENR
jgi:hypothetical protein